MLRSGRLRGVRGAAWLGVLALVLNALVPIHIAFDLAEAFGAMSPRVAQSDARGVEWSILARLVGHTEANGKPQDDSKGKPAPCPICGALSALAGFVPTTVASLPVPPPAAMPAALAAIGAERAGVPLAYRSRAPPTA